MHRIGTLLAVIATGMLLVPTNTDAAPSAAHGEELYQGLLPFP